ncbi:hypothetical protein JNJ66_06505 [Candidatus Saccharibacteria bacterium]|nr:hypothetical protein [Candidatus Saccharibacteria bacterium]
MRANPPLPETTPLIFTDGTAVYDELATTYRRHTTGYFILAPSGAGKTHFVNAQATRDWIDGDTLWMTTGAHPAGEWWLKPLPEIQEIERRSDVITLQAKRLGFWIIGTDCYSILPDAVVVPDWETHQRYILARENGNYDGGATSAQLEGVQRSRRYIASFAGKGVPLFTSVEAAAAHLARKNTAIAQ